eukprot:scaffold1924_cov92-Cylindrotheca_fusiformis.AAC.3
MNIGRFDALELASLKIISLPLCKKLILTLPITLWNKIRERCHTTEGVGTWVVDGIVVDFPGYRWAWRSIVENHCCSPVQLLFSPNA